MVQGVGTRRRRARWRDGGRQSFRDGTAAYERARPESPRAASSGASAMAPVSSSRFGPGSRPVYVRLEMRYSAPEAATAEPEPEARSESTPSARLASSVPVSASPSPTVSRESVALDDL